MHADEVPTHTSPKRAGEHAIMSSDALLWQPFTSYTPTHSATGPHASPIDYIHRPLLPRSPRQQYEPYAGKLHEVSGEWSSLAVGPFSLVDGNGVLIGIINGNENRRKLLGCTWLRLPRPPRMRVLWVLGNASLTTRWSQPDAATLLVRCGERMYMHMGRKGKTPSAFTGTFTMYYKVIEFLLFAATQPEEIAVRVDDDAFVSPFTLAAYASLVHRLGPDAKVYGGTFEWSSWRVASMQATAFGYGFVEARGRARFAWRRCVSSLAAVEGRMAIDNATAPGACVGPIAFAKGPFMLLNQNALRWLASNSRVAADMRHADLLRTGASRIGRIDDDMQIGVSCVHVSPHPQSHIRSG